MKIRAVNAVGTVLRLPAGHIEENEIPEFGIRIRDVENVGHGPASAFGPDDVIHMLHYLAVFPLLEVVASDRIRICRPGGDAYELVSRRSWSGLGRAVILPEQSPDEVRLAGGPRSSECDADAPGAVVSIHLMRFEALHGVVIPTA